jgi:MFS transporter, PAT family, beta-lactamase induction signal transducer AmpG
MLPFKKTRNANPNLLSSAEGRAFAFFYFYLIDGVLIGFMGIFLAMRMRAQNVGVDDIGLFVAAVYLPASWKWLFGPLVDLCYVERLGRRRGWILGAEALMMVTLLAAMQIDFVEQFTLFTITMLLVNLFAALQRIAVNALACAVLTEQERGTANGMMYAGGYLGQIVGGSGVILLSAFVPFKQVFLLVIASILAVMLFVAVPLREPKTAVQAGGKKSGLAAVKDEVRSYAVQAFNAFRGSRAALVGLLFVVLPAGAWAMSLSLGTNLMVEFGMSDGAKSILTLISILVAAAASLAGGYLSDRFGRRRTLALYMVGSALPALWMAYVMYQRGWIMPIDQNAAVHPIAPLVLIVSYWAVTLLVSAFQGLLYTTRSALFMDICTPAVAATQFTAYVAMVNLTIVYSSAWQGRCLAKLGYPSTLAIDALLGVISLPLLLLMTRPRTSPPAAVGGE